MKNDSHLEDNKKKNISPSKVEALQTEMSRLQDSHQAEVNDLKAQIEFFQEKIHELELSARINQGDQERDLKELQ